MTEETHILVVDDDARLRSLLRDYLTKEGFRITLAEDSADARRKMSAITFDLMILDVMMPGESGLDLAKSVRGDSGVPILMLTAMGETGDRILGLEAGADDYLPKPFEPRELILRIQSILRRIPSAEEPARSSVVRLGGLQFDLGRELLLRGDSPIKLTTTETALMKVLAAEPGRIMSREELTQILQIDGGDRAVDVQVTRLRRKVEPDPKIPRYLQTVRGRGYVLRPDG
ncbi:MAG: response regulator [Alphaproteobacteria bacterium]|jgi:two-component system phosphate regulon response regulator OmpR|uniref:response regulator n=1 Tax=Pacificispira sp. TaxID=2888761 RepID=UPI001B241C84|nr:response regulator [Alphaproteobacteria bacterium]MBO6863190.1 response regulator [Alphaproteobacteria bacterium]MEC9265129.1 response regulator [Pseudomonadota bacterium]